MKQNTIDLSQPQPSLPEYFGTSAEDLSLYCETMKGFHPEVDDPIQEETDETSVIVAGHGKQHGRLRILNSVLRPTTSLTRIRATITSDSPPI